MCCKVARSKASYFLNEFYYSLNKKQSFLVLQPSREILSTLLPVDPHSIESNVNLRASISIIEENIFYEWENEHVQFFKTLKYAIINSELHSIVNPTDISSDRTTTD